jgi:hypothetical protein
MPHPADPIINATCLYKAAGFPFNNQLFRYNVPLLKFLKKSGISMLLQQLRNYCNTWSLENADPW